MTPAPEPPADPIPEPTRVTAQSPRVVWPPPAAEPEPEPASEAEPEPVSEAEPEPTPPPDRESTAEMSLITAAQLIADSEARAELDALSKAEPERESESESESEPESATEPGDQSEPEPPHTAPFDYAHEPGFDREASPGVPLSDADWAWTQPASRIPTIDAREALASPDTVRVPPAPVRTPEPAAAPAPLTGQAPPEPAAAPAPLTGQAPAEPPADDEAGRPGLVERSRLRRRARYLRRLREVQLRDIGGFMLELHRLGRERPDLVRAKVEWAADTDRELNGLELALDGARSLRELREAGIGGACEHCGSVHGSADRFCATCGESLRLPLDDQLDDDPR